MGEGGGGLGREERLLVQALGRLGFGGNMGRVRVHVGVYHGAVRQDPAAQDCMGRANSLGGCVSPTGEPPCPTHALRNAAEKRRSPTPTPTRTPGRSAALPGAGGVPPPQPCLCADFNPAQRHGARESWAGPICVPARLRRGDARDESRKRGRSSPSGPQWDITARAAPQQSTGMI